MGDYVVLVDSAAKHVVGKGWSGTILSIVSPSKIIGIEAEKIKKVAKMKE